MPCGRRQVVLAAAQGANPVKDLVSDQIVNREVRVLGARGMDYSCYSLAVGMTHPAVIRLRNLVRFARLTNQPRAELSTRPAKGCAGKKPALLSRSAVLILKNSRST
jgi:hypothetical protein